MNVDSFLDTNVIVYSFDKDNPEKQKRARELVQTNAFSWSISWQVVQEFSFVALYRFKTPLKDSDLHEYLDLVLLPHCFIHSSSEIYRTAIKIHSRTQYRFYDSLIIAAALQSGASILYSEDMQHGRKIGGLEIRNPFLSL